MTKKLLTQSLNGEITTRPPFWFMRQAGRYLPEYRELRKKTGTFIDLCLNPVAATEVTLQPIRRFNPDAAILFSDILIVPYGLGMKVHFKEGVGPLLDSVSKAKDLNYLSIEKNFRRIEATYETVSNVRTALPDNTSLIGFAGSPWTVATYMVEGKSSKDYRKVKGWAYSDPVGFKELIEILIEATVCHLSNQITAGADVVKLFDSWSGVLSPDEFDKWVMGPTQKICSRLKAKHPNTKIIGFPKGAGIGYQRFAFSSGVDAVALDTSVPTDWAAENLQKLLPVQGNLDPISLVEGGSAMLAQAEKIRRNLRDGPFIFNLGHGVLPSTPVQNVIDLAEYLRKPLTLN
jgi:uroporphyrinogen decarboxylase